MGWLAGEEGRKNEQATLFTGLLAIWAFLADFAVLVLLHDLRSRMQRERGVMINPMQMGARAKKDSQADHWQTPPHILDKVSEFFDGLWTDPCPANPTFDGLSIIWPSRTYINPPFSQYREWALHGRQQTSEQIWMSHHNHDTQWWNLLECDAMCLLYDRVKFIDPTTGKPNSTAIGKCQTLRYRGRETRRFQQIFKGFGTIVEVMR